jgi:hypothetical protein
VLLTLTQPPALYSWPFDWTAGYGLGDVQSATNTVGLISGAASVGTSIAAMIPNLLAASAVPVIGAAIAAATIIITQIIKNSGCGQTCIETSQWANQAEKALEQNIQAYFSNSTRYASQQALALANFDAVWAQLVATCGQPGTGNAGVRCISDRQAGACTWKQTSSSPLLAYPGEPQPGECWNWFSGYRDPIANDPSVQPDPPLSASSVATSATDAAGNLLSSVGVSSSYAVPVLIGLAVLLALAVMP